VNDIVCISPVDGSVVARRRIATDPEVAQTLVAARQAQREWSGVPLAQRKAKVLAQIRDTRGGEKLYDSRWRKRQTGEGIFAEQIGTMFEVSCRRAGLGDRPKLSTAGFCRPNEQLSLL